MRKSSPSNVPFLIVHAYAEQHMAGLVGTYTDYVCGQCDLSGCACDSVIVYLHVSTASARENTKHYLEKIGPYISENQVM